MLTVNALDFMNYKSALKGNYRKGVHVFRCILENPTQAADFAANLGGVCVVFGVPIGQDDRNSQQLLALLQASSVIDQAALTWVSQWSPDYADDWNTMAADSDRAGEMAANELIWRAVGSSPVGAGKVIATIAGLNCQDYADMTAVAASSTAMAAVAASYIAVAAVYGSSVAVDAVKANETAWATLTGATSAVMGKAVAILAGLNPDSYADMTAVAASSTAMTAVAASSTAMTAVAASSTAMAAVIANDTALNAVVASSTAMAAVAASSTAMTAVAASSAARTAITNSATAKSALASSPLKTTVTKGNGNSWETRTIRNGMGWLISCYNANSGGEAGSTWYKLDGVQTSQPAGTTNVEKFFTSSLAIYWWSSTSSVTYIPC